MHVYRPECGGWTRCVLSHQPCGLMVDGWLACAALLISTHAPIRGDSRGICEDIIRPSLSGCAYYAVRTQGLWEARGWTQPRSPLMWSCGWEDRLINESFL
jgi:hypothetical protein